MFLGILFVRTPKRKQIKCPSTDEWMKQTMVHLHDGTVFSHTQESRTDTHYNMEEVSHKWPHIVWLHWCEVSTTGKSIETGSRIMAARSQAEWGTGSDGWWVRGRFEEWRNVLKLDNGVVCTTLNTLKPLKYTLKGWILLHSLYLRKAVIKKRATGMRLSWEKEEWERRERQEEEVGRGGASRKKEKR